MFPGILYDIQDCIIWIQVSLMVRYFIRRTKIVNCMWLTVQLVLNTIDMIMNIWYWRIAIACRIALRYSAPKPDLYCSCVVYFVAYWNYF